MRLCCQLSLLMILGLSLSACSANSFRPAPEDELEEMRARIVELQRQAVMAEVELEHLRRRIASLEQSVEDGRAEAAAGARSVDPGEPLPEVRAVIEEADLDVPPPAAAGQEVAAASEPAPAASPGITGPGAGIPPEAQALYDRGYTLYHQGQYLDAESSFHQFLRSYPESPLADNAQYWIGEARYARGDYAGALDAFRESVERYPGGNKVPDSLLKIGQSLESLNDMEGARVAYEEVVERFPESAAAAVAEQRRRDLP